MNNIPVSIATGENGELNVLEKQEQEINVTSCILTFMSYAIKTSGVYVEHSNRKIVTPDDIKRAMMVEVFLYFDRGDLQGRVSQWRQLILDDMQNEESDEEYSDEDESREDEGKLLHDDETNRLDCKCEICNQMTNIDEQWKKYSPDDELGKIFKKHIDLISSSAT
jgi:hypothetical protein|tara:strand:+ start:135 stop:632 length:498 start_codon:yes stop_codon:yes gene_type:complete